MAKKTPRFAAAIENKIREQDKLAAAIQESIRAEIYRSRRSKFLLMMVGGLVFYGIQSKLTGSGNLGLSSASKNGLAMIRKQITEEMKNGGRKRPTKEMMITASDDDVGEKGLAQENAKVAQMSENLTQKFGDGTSPPGAKEGLEDVLPAASNADSASKGAKMDPDTLPNSTGAGKQADVESNGPSNKPGTSPLPLDRSLASTESKAATDGNESAMAQSAGGGAEKLSETKPGSRIAENPYRPASVSEVNRVQSAVEFPALAQANQFREQLVASKIFQNESMVESESKYEIR